MKNGQKGINLLETYKENKERIGDIFSRKEVILAYIFGSAIGGKEKMGPLSDLDFAVYIEESVDGKSELYLEILNELLAVLGDNIDLVMMNNASTLMNFNIIKSGEILHQRSMKDKVRLETKIMKFNMDKKYYRERYVDQKLKIMSKKGLK